MIQRSGKTMTLHRQVVEALSSTIKTESLAPGTRLPSTRALCDQYGVSLITIRSALRELKATGIVESRPGSGFFVKAQRQKAPSMGNRVIALLTTAVNNPFFADIMHGMEALCRDADYRILVASSNNDIAQEACELSKLSKQVAGLVVAPATEDGNYLAYAHLLESKVPFVFIDRYVANLAVPLVATDNEKGGYLATRHLIDTGCRRVVLLGGVAATSVTERAQGYMRALKEAGIPFDPALVLNVPTHEEDDVKGYHFTKDVLKLRTGSSRTEPFGIFTTNDSMARGAYVAIKEAGLKIPEDVAVVGYDDMGSIFLDPPLTTVRQDTKGIGAAAARMLLDMLHYGKPLAARTVRLRPELIIRNSTHHESDFSLARHLAADAQMAAAMSARPRRSLIKATAAR